MLFWDAVVLIVLIVAVAVVLQARLRRPDAHDEDRALAHAADEITELKARIQVLERVITDNHGSRQLDAEIERLRER